MNGSLEGISDSFMQISSNIEEQTAASQEMSSSLMIINEKSVILKDETIKTGQSFYDISKMIDEVRIIGYNHSECIDISTQIEVCISDHLVWRWRVYNMILGFVKLDESTVGTHHTCRLGTWIDKLNSQDVQINTFIKELDQPHEDLHRLAKEAIRTYNNKDSVGAEGILLKMDAASVKVVNLLKKLKENGHRI